MLYATHISDDLGHVHEYRFPTVHEIVNEPVMDGFEHVARAATYDADVVMVSDWLDANDYDLDDTLSTSIDSFADAPGGLAFAA